MKTQTRREQWIAVLGKCGGRATMQEEFGFVLEDVAGEDEGAL